MIHIGTFAGIADPLEPYADRRGRIPLPGDRRKDFDFGGEIPGSVSWDRFCRRAAEEVENIQRLERLIADKRRMERRRLRLRQSGMYEVVEGPETDSES